MRHVDVKIKILLVLFYYYNFTFVSIMNCDRQKFSIVTLHESKVHYAESVKERLDNYDISTPPDLHALADVMIMLCIRSAELITLHITDAGVTGYAKNRGQPDIP